MLVFHVKLGIEDILFRKERRVQKTMRRRGRSRGRGWLKSPRERRADFRDKKG